MPTPKTIIVTGASRGLGAAAARIAARMGAQVALTARSESGLAAQVAQIEAAGGRALAIPGDIGEETTCTRIVEQTLAHFGQIDALINNAAILEPVKRLSQTTSAEWEHNLRINLLSVVMLTASALPALRERAGRVINVSSGAAVKTITGWSAYCVSKAALNHYTRMLAAEEPAITALAVRPGQIDTDMQTAVREKGGEGRMAPEQYAAFVESHATGQLLAPKQPGSALAALALHAPNDWSGDFVGWNDERVAALVAAHSG